MQTLTVNIQDNYIKSFMSYVNNHSENITISKDENLKIDPFFYERKKELHKIKKDVDSGNIKMIENDDFWNEVDSYVETLQK